MDQAEKNPQSRRLVEPVLYLVAIPAALTVFGRLNTEFDFGGILRFVASHWRNLTHLLWADLASLLNIRLTPMQADILTFSTMVAAGQLVQSLIRRTKREMPPRPNQTVAIIQVVASSLLFTALFYPYLRGFFSMLLGLEPGLVVMDAFTERVAQLSRIFPIPLDAYLTLLYFAALFVVLAMLTQMPSGRFTRTILAIQYLAQQGVLAVTLAMSEGLQAGKSVSTFGFSACMAFLLLTPLTYMAVRYYAFGLVRIVVVFLALWASTQLLELIQPIADYFEALSQRAG